MSWCEMENLRPTYRVRLRFDQRRTIAVQVCLHPTHPRKAAIGHLPNRLVGWGLFGPLREPHG